MQASWSESWTLKLSVSVGVELDISLNDDREPCVKTKVTIGGGGLEEEFKLPEVCLTKEGVCTDVNSGGGDIRATATVCWAGRSEICVTVTGEVKIFGKWYESDPYKKCVSF
jgi:hypothetical protein